MKAASVIGFCLVFLTISVVVGMVFGKITREHAAKKFYVLWTYGGYSGVMEIYGDTEENILKSLYFYSEDFKKKANIYISENPPVFPKKL